MLAPLVPCCDSKPLPGSEGGFLQSRGPPRPAPTTAPSARALASPSLGRPPLGLAHSRLCGRRGRRRGPHSCLRPPAAPPPSPAPGGCSSAPREQRRCDRLGTSCCSLLRSRYRSVARAWARSPTCSLTQQELAGRPAGGWRPPRLPRRGLALWLGLSRERGAPAFVSGECVLLRALCPDATSARRGPASPFRRCRPRGCRW